MPRPSAPSPRSFLPRAFAALPLVALCAAPLVAQTWVTVVPGTKKGDPAVVQVLPGESTAARTVLAIQVPGFWKEDVLGDDGVTYQRLTFPGIPCIDEAGAPELPVARCAVAVPSNASTLLLQSVEVLQAQTYSGIHVYPHPGEGYDEDPSEDPGPGDTQGFDDKFTIDPAIYGSSGNWPPQIADASFPVTRQLGPVLGGKVAVNPVSWDPSADRLTVRGQMKVSLLHDTGIVPTVTLTKLKAQAASGTFVNWNGGEALGYYADLVTYEARYLILAQPTYWYALSTFKAHKQALGYEVTIEPIPAGGTPAIRQTIADWYHKGDPGMDHFCLLVGDVDVIPQPVVFSQGTLVFTDDLYGSVGDDDLVKEVHAGRLSVDDEADLQQQLKKIMDYETSPIVGGRYDRALLVAHKQGAPGKYQGAQEAVRTANYAHPPTFLTAYGANGALDGTVVDDMDAGVGVVCYRGHGSTNSWSEWNIVDQSFNKTDALSLANDVHPVVWSFACTNANIGWQAGTDDDCLSETWLEADGIGAVASYAATRETATSLNHEHDQRLFQTVFGLGVTTHGMALDLTEMLMWIFHGDHPNLWSYLLLGDPSMTVRTQVPTTLLTSLPSSVDAGVSNGSFQVSVTDDQGLPIPDALLSGHKAAFLAGGGDEFEAALWTDAAGHAQVDLSQLTPGQIEFVARLADGSVKTQKVTVGMGPAWTDLGHGLAGDGAVVPQLVGVGSLHGGSPMSLLMKGARPSSTAWFILSLVEDPLPFKGGLLIPCILPPSIILPLPTDAHGDLGFTLTWPDGIPSKAEFFVQYWIQDPAGPYGFSASNGLRGLTP